MVKVIYTTKELLYLTSNVSLNCLTNTFYLENYTCNKQAEIKVKPLTVNATIAGLILTNLSVLHE